MELKLIYKFRVVDGKMQITHRKQLDNDIKQFEGKEMELIIQRRRKRRSLEQNAYYWAVVVPMVQEGMKQAGWNDLTKDIIHDFLRDRFLKDLVTNEETGEQMMFTKSTTELTTVQFMEYLAEIQQWATEYLQIYIPDPNEQIKIEI